MSKVTPEWLTTVFTGVIAATGIWALIYASSQIREARSEAQIQHLLTLEDEYKSEPMVTYRKVCAGKRLKGENEPDEEIGILDFFETIALLANRGYLNDEDVWEIFSNDIYIVYSDDRDNIDQHRKDDPADYSGLMLLLPRLDAIEKVRGGTANHPSKDDIRTHWESELKIGGGTPVTRQKDAHAK
jgi:hypothetical protein